MVATGEACGRGEGEDDATAVAGVRVPSQQSGCAEAVDQNGGRWRGHPGPPGQLDRADALGVLPRFGDHDESGDIASRQTVLLAEIGGPAR